MSKMCDKKVIMRILPFLGTVSVPCSEDLTPSTVYNYLVINALRYGLSKVRICSEEKDVQQASSILLTYSYSAEKDPVQAAENFAIRDKTDYDGNVAVHFVATKNVDVVNLPFFVALGSKKEFYPRPYMFSKMSSLKRRQRVYSNTDVFIDSETGNTTFCDF